MALDPKQRDEFWDDCETALPTLFQSCLSGARAISELPVHYPTHSPGWRANMSLASGNVEISPAFPLLTYLWFREANNRQTWSRLGWGAKPTAEPLGDLTEDERTTFLGIVDPVAQRLAQRSVEFWVSHEVGHLRHGDAPRSGKSREEVFREEFAADAFAAARSIEKASSDLVLAGEFLSGALAGFVACFSNERNYPTKTERMLRISKMYGVSFGQSFFESWLSAERTRFVRAGINPSVVGWSTVGNST